LALISVRHSFCIGVGVERVGLAVGLAEAREVVEVKHLDTVFSVKPESLVARGDAALLVTADAPQDLVLPWCKGFEGGCFVDGFGGAILEDVMRPPRVAGEHNLLLQ
jgi:hypothetical protein